ncbi:MAG TPA: hypothetical protein VIY54_07645 [Steroidobacteraceae bacterium]
MRGHGQSAPLGSSLVTYQGGCHCGAIGYSYRTELAPGEWPIRACQCAFCRAHGARTTSDPNGVLEFHARQPALRLYRFAQCITDFLLCGTCGIYIGASCESAAKRFGVVNVNVLKPYLAQLRDAEPMSYEGESIAERTARREQRWTPCLQVRRVA